MKFRFDTDNLTIDRPLHLARSTEIYQGFLDTLPFDTGIISVEYRNGNIDHQNSRFNLAPRYTFARGVYCESRSVPDDFLTKLEERILRIKTGIRINIGLLNPLGMFRELDERNRLYEALESLTYAATVESFKDEGIPIWEGYIINLNTFTFIKCFV